MNDAMMYEALPEGSVRCGLCAHRCLIEPGKQGICQVRENREGRLYTHVYGPVIAEQVDPIEKKPLYHFFPGSTTYSVAAPGCNFRCQWCQNWEISQLPRQQRSLVVGKERTPEEIVNDAKEAGCQSIAYTYTEPTIFAEYALDIARLANGQGIHNVMVSNGYMTRQMLEAFHPYLDAVNIDLKAFSDATYRKYVGGRLQPVLDNLIWMRQSGLWVEVTMLLIAGLNDDSAELHEAAKFLVEQLGPNTPWHLSRYYPDYRMNDRPPTPSSVLQSARKIGQQAGLRYVYLGNISDEVRTECHECGQLLVRRTPFAVVEDRITCEGRCSDCGTAIPGVGMGGAKAVSV